MGVGRQAEALKLLGTLDLFGAIAFDNVADLDVLVAVDTNAALVALLDRLDIVFEAAQRGNLALVDDLESRTTRTLSSREISAIGDVATGNIADLRTRNTHRGPRQNWCLCRRIQAPAYRYELR